MSERVAHPWDERECRGEQADQKRVTFAANGTSLKGALHAPHRPAEARSHRGWLFIATLATSIPAALLHKRVWNFTSINHTHYNHALVAFHSWTFLFGPSFCAAIGNGITLGTLMYRSGLVPRRLALLGVFGGPLAFLGTTGTLFDLWDQNAAPQSLLTIGEFYWELSLGIYLIVRGFTAAGLASLGFPAMPADGAPRVAST